MMEMLLNQMITAYEEENPVPVELLSYFSVDMKKIKTKLINDLSDDYQQSLDAGASPDESMLAIRDTLISGFTKLSGTLERYERESSVLQMLRYYIDDGYYNYLFLSEKGVNTCERCAAFHGKLMSQDELFARHLTPPLHPNCRCELIVMDSVAAMMYTRYEEAFLRNLETAIDHREGFERGGIYLLDHPASGRFLHSVPLDALSRLTDSRGNILMDLTKPFGYVAPTTLPDAIGELRELIGFYRMAQEYRAAHKWDSFGAFPDWLTQGIPSGMWYSAVDRWDEMTQNPSLLTVLNFFTLGTSGMVVGAIDPDEMFSLQHWMDMICTAFLVYAFYRKVTGSSGYATTGLFDDLLRATAGRDGKILRIISADDLNALVLKAHPNYQPSYLPGSMVYQIRLAQDTQYVRVYGRGSEMAGKWIMKAEDVVGLTPAEIKNRFALDYIPEYICDVAVPEGTLTELSIANGIFGNTGLGLQYHVDEVLDEWFTNPRQLQ